MSAPIALVLDRSTVTVVIQGDPQVHVVTFAPDAPVDMLDAVRRIVKSPTGIIIVVGLSHLEIASPELPPISVRDRLVLLRRDADRYFPIAEAVAVALVDKLAVATPSGLLTQWVDTASTLGPVRAIVSAPQLCPQLVHSGTAVIPAGEGEIGQVTIADGLITLVRRIPIATSTVTSSAASSAASSPASSAASSAASPNGDPGGVHHVSAMQIGEAALSCLALPLDRQLLDQSLSARLRSARNRRLLTASALLCTALLVLVGSANHWRDNVLAATEARASALEAQVGPAERALGRHRQALAEIALVQEATQRAGAPGAPLYVLASVTRVLPKDTFVQRISWDGSQWLVEGTTGNAPRLVPILDADHSFRDVHVASPGQRFLDAGRQRESFAINFGMQRGGADGAP